MMRKSIYSRVVGSVIPSLELAPIRNKCASRQQHKLLPRSETFPEARCYRWPARKTRREGLLLPHFLFSDRGSTAYHRRSMRKASAVSSVCLCHSLNIVHASWRQRHLNKLP